MLDRILVLHAGGGLLPLVLLLLALSTVFIFAGDRGYFYRPNTNPHHNFVSSEHLAVAVNLSPAHRFLLFHHETIDFGGKHTYAPYNRFPIGGYVGIKLATLPFVGSKSAQVYAARVLLLLAFAAAAVLAYLSISRLTSNRWIALTVTLLAFSSYYLLYYNDMIAPEGMLDLFGVMLTFHGMVVFMQDGRFRQLLVKTCIALLLGWHVLALLLTFVILGIASELLRARSAASPSTPAMFYRGKHLIETLLRSRYLLLGVVALLFSVSVLSFNLANEYFALDAETPLTELPSFKSFVTNTGVQPTSSAGLQARLDWQDFMEGQFARIARVSVPYSLLGYTDWAKRPAEWLQGLPMAVIGGGLSAACLIGLLFTRHRILFATLLTFGFVWALPMRHTTVGHEFEAIWYIGIPLVLFSLILMYIHKRAYSVRFLRVTRPSEGQPPSSTGSPGSGIPVVAVLAIAALVIFAVSSFLMSRVSYSAESARIARAVDEDLANIRKASDGKLVIIPHWDNHRLNLMFNGANHALDYYLNSNYIRHDSWGDDGYLLVMSRRVDTDALLTPENQYVFLYDSLPISAMIRSIVPGDPKIASDFTVYIDEFLDGRELRYVKEPCTSHDTQARFYLHVFGDNGLPRGYENLDFYFKDHDLWTAQGCYAYRLLPGYDLDRFTTGQFNSNWRVEFDLDGSDLDRMLADSGDPVLRSNFDVYFDGSNLIYTKDSCDERDISTRFFLHVYPVDAGDLPSDHRQDGVDGLDFDFIKYGGQTEDRCFVLRQLPPYAIARIATGQYDSIGRIWQGEFDPEGRDIDKMIAESGDPVLQSNFDVYLNGRTLIYTKDSCNERDVSMRFFLQVYPVDAGDLSSDRRHDGEDSLNFRFNDYGAQTEDNRCFAWRQLPPYDIDRIATGQYTSGRRVWEGEFDVQGRE